MAQQATITDVIRETHDRFQDEGSDALEAGLRAAHAVGRAEGMAYVADNIGKEDGFDRVLNALRRAREGALAFLKGKEVEEETQEAVTA